MPMEIVDAHHHLWDAERLDYTLFRSLPVLLRPYTNADFEPLAKRHGVSGSVCVEAASAGADGWQELLWLVGAGEELAGSEANRGMGSAGATGRRQLPGTGDRCRR
jgi:predicted TIM-barrel fold metal-dependent hydrolase